LTQSGHLPLSQRTGKQTRNIKELILISVLFSACVSDEIKSVESPQSAAEAFLISIDQGNYEESWPVASALLRAKVDQDDWAKHLGNTRRPLGTLNHREVGSIEFHESLEEMPYIHTRLMSETSRVNSSDHRITLSITIDRLQQSYHEFAFFFRHFRSPEIKQQDDTHLVA